MILNELNVLETLRDCLVEQGQGQAVRMVANTYALDTKNKQNEIKSLLSQLPDDFMEDKGYAFSFLAGGKNKDGEFWTSNLLLVENLFAMGVAAGFVRETFPARMREGFPEGLPYYSVMI